MLDGQRHIATDRPFDMLHDAIGSPTTARIFLADGTRLDPGMRHYDVRPVPTGAVLTRAGALVAEDADGLAGSDARLDRCAGGAVLMRRTHVAMYTDRERCARHNRPRYLRRPLNGARHA